MSEQMSGRARSRKHTRSVCGQGEGGKRLHTAPIWLGTCCAGCCSKRGTVVACLREHVARHNQRLVVNILLQRQVASGGGESTGGEPGPRMAAAAAAALPSQITAAANACNSNLKLKAVGSMFDLEAEASSSPTVHQSCRTCRSSGSSRRLPLPDRRAVAGVAGIAVRRCLALID